MPLSKPLGLALGFKVYCSVFNNQNQGFGGILSYYSYNKEPSPPPNKIVWVMVQATSLGAWGSGFGAQRLQNPLIKEYTLNYNRNPNKV